MKRILFLTTFVLGVSYSAWASSCTSEALSFYEGSGFSCNIGDLTFSGFSFSGITDSANTVEVTTGPESGLEFPVDLSTLGPGSELASINYVVTCDTCTLDDWELQSNLATSTGKGGVIVTEFSTPGLLNQFTQGPANTTTGTGSGTFSPESSLTINTGISLGGGSSTTVTSLGSVTNLFSQTSTSTVPEPSSLILCAGLLGLLPFARRRFAR
jgi:hypothetical protein